MKFVAVLLIVSLGLISHIKGACNKAYTNGCSIPGNLNFFYKKRFTPACDSHDTCYRCGVKLGYSHAMCDSIFLRKMKQACSKNDGPLCDEIATLYYKAVRIGGIIAYRQKALDHCDQSWVKGCIA